MKRLAYIKHEIVDTDKKVNAYSCGFGRGFLCTNVVVYQELMRQVFLGGIV